MPRGKANLASQTLTRAQQMRAEVACPKPPKGCGAEKYQPCRMPSGARYDVGHGARWDTWYKLRRKNRLALLKAAENASPQKR